MQTLRYLCSFLALWASVGMGAARNDMSVLPSANVFPLPQDIKCRDGNICQGTNTTCCQLKTGGFGCCPYGPDASCCGDGTCCKLGYDCVKNNGTTGCQPQSSFCNLCQMSVGLVIDKGCTAACAALSGPLAWVCGFLLEFVGCQKLIEFISFGETPNKICHQVGLCGTACPCGRCSRLTPDSCLGLPARCPKNNTMFNDIEVNKPLPDSELRVSMEKIIAVRKSQQMMQLEKPSPLICFNGKCDASHLDCCLTCF